MKAEIYKLHFETPEMRKINIVIDKLKNGAVMLYPTDTGYTLGCQLGNKQAIEKLRSIRKMRPTHALTFLCNDLSNIAKYAYVNNTAYRTLKRLIPGPYTFILPATKLVPRLAMHPARKTCGIRVPDCNISQCLIKAMNEPIVSISAKIETNGNPDDYLYFSTDEIVDRFSKLVDIVVVSNNYFFKGESTVIDMVTDNFEIIREGANLEIVNELIKSNG